MFHKSFIAFCSYFKECCCVGFLRINFSNEIVYDTSSDWTKVSKNPKKWASWSNCKQPLQLSENIPTMENSSSASCSSSLEDVYRLADRYEVLRVVGEGGFGVVLKCLDLQRNKTVAVKLAKGDRNLSHDVWCLADLNFCSCWSYLHQWLLFYLFWACKLWIYSWTCQTCYVSPGIYAKSPDGKQPGPVEHRQVLLCELSVTWIDFYCLYYSLTWYIWSLRTLAWSTPMWKWLTPCWWIMWHYYWRSSSSTSAWLC